MRINKKIIEKIENIVGKQFADFSMEERICYSYDGSARKMLPEIVVKPRTKEEISQILILANDEEIAVIPRGAGTGLTGGSIPEGGIALVLTRMNNILELDRENLIAVVEPGVITGDFHKFVENEGLFYPPDPASKDVCTLGGNVAENAGGPRALKYGVTREYVLGLEVVLPTGEIIQTGARTMKSVAGYDLTSLIVGSEGTLGVVTKIILKLLPLPESKKTILALFDNLEMATQTVSKIIAHKIIPTTLEFLDDLSIKCVEQYLRIKFPEYTKSMLLIEIDGAASIVENESKEIERICREVGAKEIKVAMTEEEAEDLWRARRAVYPASCRVSPSTVNEDIVVPRSRIPEAVSLFRKIADKYHLNMVIFGHAGDGNLHINIQIDKRIDEEVKRAEKAAEEIFRTTLDLSGSVSGEHGIGLTKRKFLPWETGDKAIEVMKGIKKALDPKGILNPGKIFL